MSDIENKDQKDDFDGKLMADHEFDGIQELDNPPPSWLMYLFYFTVFFSALYWVHYDIFGQGPNQEEEYQQEMALALDMQQNNADEVLPQDLKALTDEASLAAGKKLYGEKLCATCHGAAGEGNAIGPNLTDEFWIHGGAFEDIVAVIKNGVLAKGMTPYKDQLTPEQITQVASYVVSLQGSNPPNAKKPQGEKYTP